jgi:hypothetical protein
LCNGQLPSYLLKINISIHRQGTGELRPIAITGEAVEAGTCKIDRF